MKFKIFIVFFICSYTFLNAQNKNESEQRILLIDLPLEVQELTYTLPDDIKKLKYYRETDGEKSSFEIKFKYHKSFYSIEFNSDGIIEDIEKTISIKEINHITRLSIQNHFDSLYSKTKILKIQLQFLFNKDTEPKLFIENSLKPNSQQYINLEIIAEIKKEKEKLIKEFTFSKKGEYIMSRELATSSYEHLLY